MRAYTNDERSGQLYVFRLRAKISSALLELAAVTRIALPYSAEGADGVFFACADPRERAAAGPAHPDFRFSSARMTGRLGIRTGSVGVMYGCDADGALRWLAPMEGLKVGVSSWRRLSDESMPPRVKSIGNYQNSRLALLDAQAAGYQDAILLDQRGKVTEGPGYNLFAVRDSQVHDAACDPRDSRGRNTRHPDPAVRRGPRDAGRAARDRPNGALSSDEAFFAAAARR